MKKITAILVTMLMLCSAANGAEKSEKKGANEVSVTYGMFTAPQVAFSMAGVLGIVFSLGNLTLDNFVMPGQLSAEYYHYFNNVLAVGGCITNDYMMADSFNKNKENLGKFKADFISIMPGVKASWFNFQNFGMYSKVNVGIGAEVLSDEITTNLALQVSPVCCEFGKEAWRGFVELGFGMNGIACFGVKHSFGR